MAGFHVPDGDNVSRQAAAVSPVRDSRQAVLVIADLLKETDLHADFLPALRRWAEAGGVGLMNANARDGMLNGWKEGVSPAGLTVIEWDELAKAESAKDRISAAQYAALRKQAMKSLDRLAGELLKQANASTMVILASPRAATDSKRKELTPVLAAGGPIAPGSLLTSASTKRDGIVTNLDVTATILDFLHMERPAELAGQSICGIPPAGGAWDTVHRIAVQTRSIYEKRTVVHTVFGVCGGALFLLMAIVLRGASERGQTDGGSKSVAAVLMWGGTAVLAVPVVFLLFPFLPVSGKWKWETENWMWAFALPSVLLAVTWGLMRIRHLLVRLLVLAVATSGSIVADAATGGRLARVSILSYDPVVGARYYGVGNEYMGLLVAWLLLACGYVLCLRPAWQGWMRWVFAGLGTGLVAFFASPALGANAGGTITAAVSTAVVAAGLFGFSKRTGWLAGLAFVAGSAVLMVILHQNGAGPTHISRFVNLIRDGRYGEIGFLVRGKLLMNLHLIRDYFGAPIFVAVLAFAAFAAFRPLPWVRRFFAEKAGLAPFLTGGVAGALAGFAVNDSGVVAAAMILLPTLYTVCMIRLGEAFPTPRTVVPAVLSRFDTPDWPRGPDPGR